MNDVINNYTIKEKLQILADAAKYDVACTSSGVDRRGKEGFLGNSASCGICHSFGADGRCISLLKILMTNHCIYDCKYCLNRCSNDVPRTTFEPDELCNLVIEFYKRNYIEGLFLSSGVLKNPTYTMEKMYETLYLLRTKYRFNGYIHVKTIPGASDDMISMIGYLADRISVNLELPTAESLQKLAPNKSFSSILSPMGQITDTIAAHRLAIGKDARMERSKINNYLSGSIFNKYNINQEKIMSDSNAEKNVSIDKKDAKADAGNKNTGNQNTGNQNTGETVSGVRSIIEEREQKNKLKLPVIPDDKGLKRAFAPAGQSTQMIIGATEETDYMLIKTTQKLYQAYDLKRVFYSAYIPINEDSALPALTTAPPLLREHRLYQADWLLRYYGFQADELLSFEKPNFNETIDPKCDWALRHLGDFPVEIQTAPYDKLLRIPGIGPKSAARIVNSRRYSKLDFDCLKKMGVVLKRAHYFITCNGKMMYNIPIEESYITRQLTGINERENWQVAHQNESYSQMSLFDDFHVS